MNKALCIVGLVLLPGFSQSADFGRLFSTPSERLYLDQLRSNEEVDVISADSGGGESAVPPPADTPIKFNGFVRRNNGYTDAWVNGEHVGSDEKLRHKLDSQDRMRIKVPDSDQTVRVKPGQFVDPVTGRVREGYDEVEQQAPQDSKD